MTVNPECTSTFDYSLETDSDTKYGGLVKRSALSIFRRNILGIVSHLQRVSPGLMIFNQIIEVIRLFQLIGPAFCVSYREIWTPTDSTSTLMSFISVFFHLIPSSIRHGCAFYALLSYSCFHILVLGLLFITAHSFKKTARVSKTVSIFLSVYYTTLYEVLTFPVFNIMFEELSYQVFMKQFNVMVLILIGLNLVLCMILVYIHTNFFSHSIVFKPWVFASVSSRPQVFFFRFNILLTSIIAFGTFANKNTKIAIISISILIYCFNFYTPLASGGFVSIQTIIMFNSTNACSIIALFVNITFLIINRNPSMVFVFVLISLWIVLSFAFSYLIFIKENRNLIILDSILDDSEEFSIVQNHEQCLDIILSGFRVAHPVCLNWDILKHAVAKWNECIDIWFAFAKFSAIYPEQNQTCIWILKSICSSNMKGSIMRSLKYQILAIAKSRETNLSPSLKKSLDTLSNQVISSKHRLQYIWDVVIQGNIDEVENATKRAFSSFEKNEAEFVALCNQYPNNRFVTRLFTRFLSEVKGEHNKANEMNEKSKKLHQGSYVSPDFARDLGLSLFHALPVSLNQTNSLGIKKNESSTVFNADSELKNDTTDTDTKDLSLIQERIEELPFPGIKISRIIVISQMLFMIIGMFGSLIYFSEYFSEDLISPLPYISQLALTRQYVYQVVTFSNRIILEQLNIIPSPKITNEQPPTNLGGTWNLINQTRYLIISLSRELQKINEIKSFKNTNDKVNRIKSYLFSPIVNYSNLINQNTTVSTSLTIQNSLIDIVLQSQKLLSNNSITFDTLDTASAYNPLKNLQAIGDGIMSVLEIFNEYLISTDLNYQNLFKKWVIILMTFTVIIYALSLLYEIKSISHNKNIVYQCLTSLPKREVSIISQKIRAKQNESDISYSQNSETTRQEENLLKIISIGSSSTISSDSLPFISMAILIAFFNIISLYEFYNLGVNESELLLNTAPHIDFISASYSLILGSISFLSNLAASYTAHSVKTMSRNEMTYFIRSRFEKSKEYINNARFGSKGGLIKPFSGFAEALTSANSVSKCGNILQLNATELSVLARCYEADVLFMLYGPAIVNQVMKEENMQLPIDRDDERIITLWKTLMYPLFDLYFYPMFNSIIPLLESTFSLLKSDSYLFLALILSMSMIIEILCLFVLEKIEIHMRSVLLLLRHCQPSTILQIPLISNVLSGIMGLNQTSTIVKDKQFFESLVEGMPNAIIICNQDGNIDYLNKTSRRIFSDIELIGNRHTDVFKRPCFIGFTDELLSSQKENRQIRILYQKEGSESELLFKAISVGGNIIFLIRDVTQAARYSLLIKDETERSSKILSSIIPKSLVSRVQSGEKNISFSVQSASIIFIDIVSFTPWCSSVQPSFVMNTLNALYLAFDTILSKYRTLCKIKYIGDCYMAAGGVFSEVNQPIEHAKESIMFGLDVIQNLKEFNNSNNTNLQIRIGIHTSGPIVAGVLGLGKPTFEIFGPPISMAQQMEHHGVPMFIHITRSVYELVYGDRFKIKERGEIETKSGRILTYLITP